MEVMEPIVVCEANRSTIDARCKQIRGRFYVVKNYDHLTEVIKTIEYRLAGLKLNPEDLLITYTSGIDVLETYGYERCATELDLEFLDGKWMLCDIRPCKIPCKPLNYRFIPKTVIAGTASL